RCFHVTGVQTCALPILRTPDGYLLRSYKDGQAKIDAYLEDYAFLAEALLELYQTTFDLHWFEAARDIVERMVALFWDDEAGFFRSEERRVGMNCRSLCL